MNLSVFIPVISFLVACLTVLLAGEPYIGCLKQRYMGQYIREDGPQSHHAKAGTPTMGGVLIIGGIIAGLLSWGIADLISPGEFFSQALSTPVILVLLTGFCFAVLGSVDDYLKISKKKNKGVSGYTKLFVQTLMGLMIGCYVMLVEKRSTIDLFGFGHLDLGWFYPLFAAFVINGFSNAVNITDGLDGLAVSTVMLTLLAALNMLSVAHPDLSLLCWVVMGACLGFFFFNRHPARIFMGDTGSLALGGVLGAMMVLGNGELWLGLIGGIFVLEVFSVISQVISFKTTGKRIFKMAPLHHHFELCGFTEVRVVYFFAGLQFLLCTLALWLYFR